MSHALSRRAFLKTAALAATGLLGARHAAAAARSAGYNVLWLMSDEHSPHALGCYGNKIVKTPHLDALARAGVAFTAAYCQDPVCVPSRASFLTGRTASKVGVYTNSGGLDDSVPTLADVFKAAGYAAGWVGKTHWGGNPDFETVDKNKIVTAEAKKRGFAREENASRLPEHARIVDWPAAAEPDSITTEYALKYIEEHRSGPFFLGVSWVKPHFPFLVQKRFHDLYKGKLDAPRVTPQMVEELCACSKLERERYGFAKLNEDQIKFAREVYYAMVTYVDDMVGQIMKKLDELGLRERTIIVYLADHGEMAGEHGLWYKNSFYEASVGVPQIWSFPKALPQGLKIDAPVMNMDVFPTLCDLCGLPKPEGLEGKSLLPLMEGQEDGKDRVAFSESFRNGMASRMIRTAKWKYCYYHEDIEQLFDMETDKEEEHNLVKAPEHAAIVKDLRARALEGWPLEKFLKSKKGGKGKKKSAKEEE